MNCNLFQKSLTINFYLLAILCFASCNQNVSSQNTPVSSQNTLQDDESNYEEKVSFEVLKPIIQKWLRSEKIDNKFTDVSDESISEISGKAVSELTEDETTWFSYFRFEPRLMDVNADGQDELAIRNYCAPVGNCQFWLLKRNADSYEIILKTLGGAVQTYKLRAEKTNGYFDLETTAHGDAFSGGINIYKFDGKEYRLSECSTYNYSVLKNGKLYELKQPIIKGIPCSE